MDWTLFKAINGFAVNHDWFEDPLRFLALDAQVFFVALLAILFLARGKWASQRARHGVVAAGFSALLALGVAQMITLLWDRPRPYVTHADAHLFIAPSHDPSFPSDHATAAFAIAVSILLRNRVAGWIAVAMAALVSVSRVAVGTHYPADVLGGAALGSLVALALWVPPVRGLTDRLADWASNIYEQFVAKLLPQQQAG